MLFYDVPCGHIQLSQLGAKYERGEYSISTSYVSTISLLIETFVPLSCVGCIEHQNAGAHVSCWNITPFIITVLRDRQQNYGPFIQNKWQSASAQGH